MSIKKLFSFILLIGLIFSGIGCSKKEEKKVEEKKPFEGQSIMVVTPKLHGGLISGPILEEAKKFEEKTGAKIRVVTAGWRETIEEIKKSLKDENINYDLFLITTSWSGPLFGSDSVEAIPDEVKTKVKWDDILPIYRENILKWNGIAYALPYDGDTVTLYYRKDIFEKKEYRDKFLKEYGYELEAPTTWKIYSDIAKFFTGWDWDSDGEIEYGITGNRLVNGSAMLIYLTRAAAYAKHPDDKGFYFDIKTMKPKINNLGFKKALKEYVEALKYGPDGMINFSGNDVRETFVSGKVAMAIDWANIGVMAVNSPISIVKGKVGYAKLPASNEVFNSTTNEWENRNNLASSMVGNYIFLVNKNSKNKKLAFEFASHMSSPELTKVLTATGSTGINPSRFSHFDDPASWQKSGFSKEDASSYLGTIKEALANPNYIFDIRIEGSDKYYKILDDGIYSALKGERSADEALDFVATKWEELTESLGREKQLKQYRQSLNIE